MMDSSPIYPGYNTRHCGKRPFPLAIVDIPFHNQKKGPLRRAGATVIKLLLRDIKIPDRKMKSFRPRLD